MVAGMAGARGTSSGVASRDARRLETVALLLGAAALVLPVAGLARYLQLLDGAEGLDGQAFLIGAASEASLLGPAILGAAVGLWVAASRVPGHRCRPGGRGLLVAAGLLLGVSFSVAVGQALGHVGFFTQGTPTDRATSGQMPTLPIVVLCASQVPVALTAAWIAARSQAPREHLSDDR